MTALYKTNPNLLNLAFRLSRLLFSFQFREKDTTLVLFCLVSYLGFKEYITLVPSRKADRKALFWAYLAIPFQYYWIHTTWYVMFLIFIPVYAFVIISTRLVIAGETERFIRAVSTIQWGLLATVYAVSHLAYMVTFPAEANGTNGPLMVIFVVLITELNDIFQFIWGKAFGKTKISPKVSPGKTWEGFLGSLTSTAVLSAILGPWLTPLPTLSAC